MMRKFFKYCSFIFFAFSTFILFAGIIALRKEEGGLAYWLPYFPGTYLWIVSVVILVELKDRK